MSFRRLMVILLRGLVVVASTFVCAMAAFYFVTEVWMPGDKPFDEYYVALVGGLPVGGLVGLGLGVWLASKVRSKTKAL